MTAKKNPRFFDEAEIRPILDDCDDEWIRDIYLGLLLTDARIGELVDTAVILSAGYIFGWKQAMNAMITLYVSGLVSETVLEGGGTARTAMIVTAQPEAVSHRVMDDLERGVTSLEGTGAYSGTSRAVLYCVISRAEVTTLKAIVRELDPVRLSWSLVRSRRRWARASGR